MGYNGMGYQRWIANLKPRKFLSNRSKPDGGGMENIIRQDINDYYHLRPNKLDNLLKKKFSPDYRTKLKSEIKKEHHKQNIFNVISITIAVLFIVAMFVFFSSKFNLF